ncbi:uncharacterized protein LOC132257840 [Phlebotomus argentipes]|uniref:uncharacterized protein LOC132257840 n=1 Tax=Phlebotomus argentipes TaxID=94469 RepID=UPI002892B849|nr:uncharacterized protein LOC132257840 [Phlebotomus argentipes]
MPVTCKISLVPLSPHWPLDKCPLCDSSVYGYCSDRLFHDACCCDRPNGGSGIFGASCLYTDCSFLYANSCWEHDAITNCCCNQ